MSQVFQPRPDYSARRSYSRRGVDVLQVVRERGVYGLALAMAATAVGLAPLAALIWWSWLRPFSVPLTESHASVRVQVKPRQHTQDAEQESPGETALLYVTCEVQQPGGWRELLQWDDAARGPDDYHRPDVRDEQVYLRPAGHPDWPFGLLGQPPVSAWLPAGEYEILVVYSSGRGWGREGPAPFPWVSERVVQELPAGRRTQVRVPLSHHERSLDAALKLRGQEDAASGRDRPPPLAALGPLLSAIGKAAALPTPGGVLMDLPEPVIHHRESHRGCEMDLEELTTLRREWTRGQLQTLYYWLPPEATAARDRLEAIDRALGWREFLQGWYCFAAAGVAGLVFARWMTVAALVPGRSRIELIESLKLLGGIFLLAALVWFVVCVLSDGPGGGLPIVPFR